MRVRGSERALFHPGGAAGPGLVLFCCKWLLPKIIIIILKKGNKSANRDTGVGFSSFIDICFSCEIVSL